MYAAIGVDDATCGNVFVTFPFVGGKFRFTPLEPSLFVSLSCALSPHSLSLSHLLALLSPCATIRADENELCRV